MFKRLEVRGYDEATVRAALPDWWDDEIADNPSGYAEGCMHIARGLSIPLSDVSAGPYVGREVKAE